MDLNWVIIRTLLDKHGRYGEGNNEVPLLVAVCQSIRWGNMKTLKLVIDMLKADPSLRKLRDPEGHSFVHVRVSFAVSFIPFFLEFFFWFFFLSFSPLREVLQLFVEIRLRSMSIG